MSAVNKIQEQQRITPKGVRVLLPTHSRSPAVPAIVATAAINNEGFLHERSRSQQQSINSSPVTPIANNIEPTPPRPAPNVLSNHTRSNLSKQRKNKILNQKRKMKKYKKKESLKQSIINVNKELELSKKENLILSKNKLKINAVKYSQKQQHSFRNTSVGIIKHKSKLGNWGTNTYSRDALLKKFYHYIPSFNENSTTKFGGNFLVGKGAFGKVELCKIEHMNLIVASKTVSGTLSDIQAEASVMQQVAGHPNFPFLYGIRDPGIILMEFIGNVTSGNIVKGKSVSYYLGKKVIKLSKWFQIATGIVNAVMFLHSKGILHNDIHGNNVLVTETFETKLIDFGKCTLIECPITYNILPGTKEHEKYNKYHRHLAHELRNKAGTTQTVLTDTYSVGYLIKNIGYFESHDIFLGIGSKLKRKDPSERYLLQDSKILLLKDH